LATFKSLFDTNWEFDIWLVELEELGLDKASLKRDYFSDCSGSGLKKVGELHTSVAFSPGMRIKGVGSWMFNAWWF